MKNLKKNEGITLIALIITIIILLILAVVTIMAVDGDGIIDKAKQAKAEYQNAQAEEQNILDKYLAEMEGLVGNNTLPGGAFEEVTNYTAEDIEANEYLYGIGATDSTYVVASFNEDYTEVVITRNGENSDGLMMEFAPWTITSPMQDKKDTLQTAIIKQGVTNIGSGDGGYKGAFGNCTNLTNIQIPNSVTSIGLLAFSECTSLMEINIPNSVTVIYAQAFNPIGSGSTIYCQTQEVADLFIYDSTSITDTNYDSSITTVVVDSSRF